MHNEKLQEFIFWKSENEILYNGDCLDILKDLSDNSIDAIVTDPPAGISFMNRNWDGDKGGRDHWIKWMTDIMEECYRVLKDGAHVLVWGLPRTSHWTAMAIENAGFEIRDCVHSVFASGFPKSANISKQIDKKFGAEREVIKTIKKLHFSGDDINSHEGWSRPSHRNPDGTAKTTMDITAPATPEAKQFNGQGTGLKPACEHWILARKKIAEKTIAEQVLKNGCGSLDIDGCRIPYKSDADMEGARFGTQTDIRGNNYNKNRPSDGNVFAKNVLSSNQGRWPANVICQNDALCDGTVSKSGDIKPHSQDKNTFGAYVNYTGKFQGDSGSKSRYFDIDLWAERNGILQFPKASKSEKNKGCEGLEESKSNNTMAKLRCKKCGYVNQHSLEGRNVCTCENPEFEKAEHSTRNNHPTVKSLPLMSWLVKLISKPNDIVLDPFAGSGTTGVACKRLGRKFIGVEKEKEYCEIVKARISAVESQQTTLFEE